MSSCSTRCSVQPRLESSQVSRNVPSLTFPASLSSPTLLLSVLLPRTLRISPRGQTLSPSSWRHLSSVLAACIPLLPNLNDLSVHPALLDNLLLNNLLLSSIGYLRLNYPLTRRLFPLELLEGSLLPRSGSRPPVRIPCRFAIWITSKADATWANRVLRFLQHLGCKAKYFELLVVADLGSRSKLLFNHDFGLNALRVSTSPDFVLSLLPWMSDLQAAATFPTLRELSVNVRSPLKEGGYGRNEYDYPTLGE